MLTVKKEKMIQDTWSYGSTKEYMNSDHTLVIKRKDRRKDKTFEYRWFRNGGEKREYRDEETTNGKRKNEPIENNLEN